MEKKKKKITRLCCFCSKLKSQTTVTCTYSAYTVVDKILGKNRKIVIHYLYGTAMFSGEPGVPIPTSDVRYMFVPY